MDKTKKIIFGIETVLAVLVVLTVPVAAGNVLYFDPQDSIGNSGEEVTVLLYCNATDAIGGGQVRIDFDRSTVNITQGVEMTETTDWISWNFYPYGYAGHDYAFITFAQWGGSFTGDMVGIARLTLVGDNPGVSPLDMPVYPDKTMLFSPEGPEVSTAAINGTFACTGVPETFDKELVVGWNLISLPLAATDMTVANVIDTSLSGLYDALYKYDAGTHSFVSLSSTDTMDNGVGYFIYMTAADTWSYEGTSYASIAVGLSQGLNMVGWVNESGSSLPGALNSIAGKYNYVARWNTTERKYEIYEPGAPAVFNDFNTMDRGEGYWIAASEGCTLEYPTP